MVSINSTEKMIVEHVEEDIVNDENAAEYLTSEHKNIFLQFIKVEKNFIKNPESYPDYLNIMTTDLNAVDFRRCTTEWIEILNAWINFIKEAYQLFIRSNEESSFSVEDEELIQVLQEHKLWSDPTFEQITYVLDFLENAPNHSNGWKTIAIELEHLGGEKHSDIFWRRAFQRIGNRLKAKRNLIGYITQYHPHARFVNKRLGSLSVTENRLLRCLSKSTNSHKNEIKPNLDDFLSYCRICLSSTSSKMTYLFDTANVTVKPASVDERITILDKLNHCSCLSTKAHANDGFPQYICISCSVLVESAYQLKILCSKTEEKLQNLLNESISDRRSKSTSPAEIILEQPFELDTIDENYDMNEEFIIDIIEAKQDDIGGLEETETTPSSQHTKIEVHIIDEETNETTVTSSKSLSKPNAKHPIKRTRTKASEKKLDVDGKHQCETCGIILKNISALNVHKKGHGNGKKSHQCANCSKVFQTKNSLRVHIRTHTDERPYVCETCGKAFRTVGAVKNHRAIHSDLRDFKCTLCPYSTSTKANLNIHDRTHSGVQPYECRYCPMKFSTASNMHKHMRNIHQKLKTNKCNQCERSFFSRESARKHMVTHTGLKPYHCTQCPMTYGWYNGLKKHMKIQHDNIKIPTEKSFIDRILVK